MEQITGLVKLIEAAQIVEEEQRQIRRDYYKQLLGMLSFLSPAEKEKFVRDNLKLFFNLSHFMAEEKGSAAIGEAKEFFRYLPDNLDTFVQEIKAEGKKGFNKITDTLAGLASKIL